MVSNPVSDARRAGLGIASLIAAGLGGAEALLDGDQVPPGQRPDPPGAARHVIGRLLDLSHVSWRTCVADLLADHMVAIRILRHLAAIDVPLGMSR